MEIELKLLIDTADVERLRNLPLLNQYAVGAPSVDTLFSTYFDTPGLHLKQQRSALRVRAVGDTWIQTFKGGGGAQGGLHQRYEWECEVAGASFELARLLPLIDNPQARAILALPGLVETLVPMFVTDFERTAWTLQLEQDTVVELALDQGYVVAGEAEAQMSAINEIELELKSGQLPVLLAFAEALRAQLPLQPSNISKAQRGFALRFPDRDSAL